MRYIENLSPIEAVLDERGHVKAVQLPARGRRPTIELPARTVCVAAGTSPNVIYEKEYPGTFELDDEEAVLPGRTRPRVDGEGNVTLTPRGEAERRLLHELPRRTATPSRSTATTTRTTRAASSRRWRARRTAIRTSSRSSRSARRLDPADAARARREAARALREARRRARRDACVEVNRLTPTIVEVVVHAPMAARKFQPGQFYRLQNFESLAPIVDGHAPRDGGPRAHGRVGRRGEGPPRHDRPRDGRQLAPLRGARARTSRSSSWARPGTPTEIAANETVLLCGGGLGNAVLFSIARAFKALGAQGPLLRRLQAGRGPLQAGRHRALHRPGHLVHRHRRGDRAAPPAGRALPRQHRPGDGRLRRRASSARPPAIPLSRGRTRIIAIGTDRMMNAVREARHGVARAAPRSRSTSPSAASTRRCSA